jgi:outer membrane protein assembly factor BamD
MPIFGKKILILRSCMKKFVPLFLPILAAFVLTACSKYNKVVKSNNIEYKLKKADEYYEKKSYKNAQALYEQLFTAIKGTEKFEGVYYRYAYTFYYQKRYTEAEKLFKDWLEVFPNSEKAEEVDFMRAFSFYKQSPKIELEQVNTLKAINMMQSFINQHPGSPRIKEATAIIDEGRGKLELKDAREAQLFYNLGHFRAAAINYSNIVNNYPESLRGDYYKLMVIKSYYKFAKLSIEEKQLERFEKVMLEYSDFVDRYADSKYLKEAEQYNNQSINNLKTLKNEQTSSTVGR